MNAINNITNMFKAQPGTVAPAAAAGNKKLTFLKSPQAIVVALVFAGLLAPEIYSWVSSGVDLSHPLVTVALIAVVFFLGSMQGRRSEQAATQGVKQPVEFRRASSVVSNRSAAGATPNRFGLRTPPNRGRGPCSPGAASMSTSTAAPDNAASDHENTSDAGVLTPQQGNDSSRRRSTSNTASSHRGSSFARRDSSAHSTSRRSASTDRTGGGSRRVDRTGQILSILEQNETNTNDASDNANSPTNWQKALEDIKENPADVTNEKLESVILGAGASKQWQSIQQIMTHYYAGDAYPNKSPVTVAIAVTELAQNHRWREAVDLLGKLKKLCDDETLVCPRSQDKTELLKVAYPAVVECCVSTGETSVANDILLELEATNFPSEAGPYNSAIISLASSRQWACALDLLERMRAVYKFEPHLFAVNSIINGLGRAGLWEKSVAMLHQMKDYGLEPDLVSYNTAIASCVPARQWQKALELLQEARTLGISVNTITYNSAISACGASREWRMALDLLREMRANGVMPNLRTYGAVVMACKVSRHWEGVNEIFEAMIEDGIHPDETIYQNLIGIACSCRSPAEAIRLHNAMTMSGMKADAGTLNRLTTVCARSGTHADAERFLKTMQSRNIMCDTVTRKAIYETDFASDAIKERLVALLSDSVADNYDQDYSSTGAGRPPVWSRGGSRTGFSEYTPGHSVLSHSFPGQHRASSASNRSGYPPMSHQFQGMSSTSRTASPQTSLAQAAGSSARFNAPGGNLAAQATRRSSPAMLSHSPPGLPAPMPGHMVPPQRSERSQRY